MVLTVEAGIYLPPIFDANREYIQDIMTTIKKFLYCKNVQTIKVQKLSYSESKRS